MTFHDRFVALFDEQFHRLQHTVQRLSGDPDLSADVVQEAFVRLYQRGLMPDAPTAWLISVAMNRLRNERSTRSRRLRLLTPALAERVMADPPPPADEAAAAADQGDLVRRTLARLSDRERALLLLHAEGYTYREIAVALELNEASLGVFLARARRAFRRIHEEPGHAPG